MLLALYFHEKRWIFIVLGGLIGSIHRPTFYIFGISYLFYTFSILFYKKKDYKKFNKNFVNGLLILMFVSIFYLGSFSIAITELVVPVLGSFVVPGASPGTFISFKEYQFSSLFYLPFALMGLFYLFKEKKFNLLFFWALINALIVYFQFFFFNRFIIHLDVVLIILSGKGFSIWFNDKNKIKYLFIILLFLTSLIAINNESFMTKPLISKAGFELIKSIDYSVEKDARIMSISKEYSPWIKGYSERKTIAPGLFDENVWDESKWKIFWSINKVNQTKELMSVYKKDSTQIYIFSGVKIFNNPCFEVFLEKEENKLYKYIC